jgi:5-(carboxyamino)imidazole ribonucleotide mutase
MSDPIKVAVLSGSPSDAEFVQACTDQLEAFSIPHEARVLSAHRQGEALHAFMEEAERRGCQVFIAMAGMAAHLPGVVASMTPRPVLGVPLKGGVMDGLDALLSVVQMPKGVPVGTLAVGKAGARNAAILAAQILAVADEGLAAQMRQLKADMAAGAR